MKVIIVDDEPKAIELLQGYLEHFRHLELVATFRNGLKAFEFLNQTQVDLLFLDINMPHISGLSLAKMIPAETKIIFTTAYAEYAVESYEVAAVDYLLKPISLVRFTQAVSKVLSTSSPALNKVAQEIILVKSGSDTFRIAVADLLFLEKDGNYITYHLEGQKVLARASVGEALAQLPAHFLQAHKSFIVNTQKVNSIQKNALTIKNQRIPLGPSFRDQLLKILEG